MMNDEVEQAFREGLEHGKVGLLLRLVPHRVGLGQEAPAEETETDEAETDEEETDEADPASVLPPEDTDVYYQITPSPEESVNG